jgi:hypothetical protein
MAVNNDDGSRNDNSFTSISGKGAGGRHFGKLPAMSKIDIACIALMGLLVAYYFFYASTVIATPIWDGAVYLLNARGWLSGDNVPLYEGFRPPLLSWIIAGIWTIAGTENFEIIKYIQPLFTVGAGFVLYALLGRHKGKLFAFGVVALTMLNATLFFNSSQILTEGLSLFFLVTTLYLLAGKRGASEEKESGQKIIAFGEGWRWFFAGIAIALTFASRYPIIVPAVAIFIVASILRKDIRLAARTIIGAVPTFALIVLAVYLRTGTFETALAKDTNLSLLLSPFYIANSINIWGLVFLLVPVAFIFRKTYTDKFNYLFIAWFLASLAFWSANTSNFDYRFTIQFTPAVYYLAVLAIEHIAKHHNTIIVTIRKDGSSSDGNDSRSNREKHPPSFRASAETKT